MITDRSYLATLFEGAPRFLHRLMAEAAASPPADDAAFFAMARAIAHAMPEVEQIELIDAHPRLGAPPATLSAMSNVEQGHDRGAGTTGATATPRSQSISNELDRLNDAYEAHFGFRYCVFVAGRPPASLLNGMAAALRGDPDEERHRALDAVIDIAIDRHAKLSAEAAP